MALFGVFEASWSAQCAQRAVRRQSGEARLFAVGGASISSVERYSVSANEWQFHDPGDYMEQLKAGAAAARDSVATVAALKGKLYAVFNGGVTVERFDPSANVWERVAWMIPASGGRCECSAAALD